MQRYLVVSALLFLFGCGAASVRDSDLPAINDRAKAGNAVVVRISSFLGVLQGWQIKVDGTNLFGIGSGEYTEFLLPEGEYYITLKCFQPFVDWFMYREVHFEDTLMFYVRPSQTRYFLASPSWKSGKIRQSNETEAKKYIKQSKFISLDN